MWIQTFLATEASRAEARSGADATRTQAEARKNRSTNRKLSFSAHGCGTATLTRVPPSDAAGMRTGTDHCWCTEGGVRPSSPLQNTTNSQRFQGRALYGTFFTRVT